MVSESNMVSRLDTMLVAQVDATWKHLAKRSRNEQAQNAFAGTKGRGFSHNFEAHLVLQWQICAATQIDTWQMVLNGYLLRSQNRLDHHGVCSAWRNFITVSRC